MTDQDLNENLKKLGVQLLTIPAPTGDEKLRLEGWRNGIEEHGQELWRIYHWIVDCQDGSTHGIYRLRDWLEQFNVPDKTSGRAEEQETLRTAAGCAEYALMTGAESDRREALDLLRVALRKAGDLR